MAGAFAAALAPITAGMAANTAAVTAHTAQLAAHTAQLTQVERQLNNNTSRAANSTVFLQPDVLQLITNAGGFVHHNFPATLGHLDSLNNMGLRDLLVFYNCPPNPLHTRSIRLKQFLGIRP